MDAYYTAGAWEAKPGQDEAFASAWDALKTTIDSDHEATIQEATLLQDLADPCCFYTFIKWHSRQAMDEVLADIEFASQIVDLADLCDYAETEHFKSR